MESLERILGQAAAFVWGPPLLVLLVGTHVFLTICLRFIQRFLGRAIRLSFQRAPEGESDVSQFGALTTALAATIGTGNIVGVATAVASGGPGAVLWMWLTGVFGIATKYSEALLSVKYRVTTKDGLMAGGPMYVIEKGMNNKFLAVTFAALTAVTAFGIGNMVQANSISHLVNETFQISPWITGIVLTVLTAVVIIGGIKSIAKVCERLVPFMAVFYVLGCLIFLFMNLSDLPVIGPIVLTIGLLTFVFSTILGWSYYGEKAAEYLFGNKITKPYRWLWVGFVMIGSVLSLKAVWSFADITNALMAIPNLISLIALNKIIVKETDEYLWQGNIDK